MAKAIDNVTLTDLWAMSAKYPTQDLYGLCLHLCKIGEVDGDGSALRGHVCELLADASIVARGTQGLDAEGIWANPDNDLTYWTNNNGYTEWRLLSDMQVGTIDKLVDTASPEVRERIDNYGYEHA